MLRPSDVPCFNYQRILKEENLIFKMHIEEKYADFFEYLTNKTGIEKINFKFAASLYNIKREVSYSLKNI